MTRKHFLHRTILHKPENNFLAPVKFLRIMLYNEMIMEDENFVEELFMFFYVQKALQIVYISPQRILNFFFRYFVNFSLCFSKQQFCKINLQRPFYISNWRYFREFYYKVCYHVGTIVLKMQLVGCNVNQFCKLTFRFEMSNWIFNLRSLVRCIFNLRLLHKQRLTVSNHRIELKVFIIIFLHCLLCAVGGVKFPSSRKGSLKDKTEKIVTLIN